MRLNKTPRPRELATRRARSIARRDRRLAMKPFTSAAWRVALGIAVALAALGAERVPERHPRRATSFEWTSDVRERLLILERHAADAARERMRSSLRQGSRGWTNPQPPAAGDGSAR